MLTEIMYNSTPLIIICLFGLAIYYAYLSRKNKQL